MGQLGGLCMYVCTIERVGMMLGCDGDMLFCDLLEVLIGSSYV